MGHPVVLRVEPVKSITSLSRAQSHWNRHHLEDHIDSSRSKFNKILVGTGSPSVDVLVSSEKFRMANRRGAIAADLICSAGKDYFLENFPGWENDSSILAPWIEANMKFLKNKYGAGLSSAVLHLDEEAPHIHAMIVPLVETKIKNRYGERIETRINYTKLFGDSPKVLLEARKSGSSDDTKLGRLQTEYAQSMGHLNLERGIRKSNKKHIKPREYRERINSKRLSVPSKKDQLSSADLVIPSVTRDDGLKTLLTGRSESMDVFEKNFRKILKNRNFYRDIAKDIPVIRTEIERLREENAMLKEEITKARDSEQSAIEELRSNKEYLSGLRALSPEVIGKALGISEEESAQYLNKLNGRKFNAVNMTMEIEKLSFNDAIILLSDHFPIDKVAAVASEKISMKVQQTLKTYDSPEIVIKRGITRAEEAKKEQILREANALRADKYRITLMHGDLPSFNLGKGKGPAGDEKFYDSSELIGLIPHLSHHNARGYNVFITPFSEHHKYILVDDIRSKESFLRKYSPAILQHSSPSSEQAVLIVPPIDHSAENEFFRRINREFGDPKISGVVHPFRLPGFTNQKPKHRKSDGRQPFVTLEYAEFRVCQRASGEVRLIEEEFRLPAKTQDIVGILETKLPNKTEGLGNDIDLDKYRKLYQKYLDHYAERADLSRIDYAVAIAMLRDGGEPEDVAEALAMISPEIESRHPQLEKYLSRQINAACEAIGPKH